MEKTRQILVKDIMSWEVVTVLPDTNVQEIARLMTEKHLHSLLVVDQNLRLLGIITETDLFLKEKGIPFSAVKLPALFEKWVDAAHLAEIYDGASHHTAADVMTEEVISVTPTETIGQAALLLFKHEFKTLPVLENGKLVGLVSRVDFIRLLAGEE